MIEITELHFQTSWMRLTWKNWDYADYRPVAEQLYAQMLGWA